MPISNKWSSAGNSANVLLPASVNGLSSEKSQTLLLPVLTNLDNG